MLHVLGILLKILGFILLFLLLLILILLITAFRYRFELKKTEGGPLYATAGVSWFIVAVTFTADYIDQVFRYQLKIFGIQILGNQPEFLARKEEKQRRKAEKGKPKELAIQSASQDKLSSEKVSDTALKKESEDASRQKEEAQGTAEGPKDKIEEPEDKSEELKNKSEGQKAKSEEPKNKSDGLKAKPGEPKDKSEGLKDKAAGIKDKAADIKNKLVSIKDKAAELKKTYDDFHGEELIRKGLKLLKKIAAHVLPRRLSGHIRFGLDDPATTGYLAGLAATFYPAYGRHFSLEPVFYEKCFEADCRGAGRVRPLYFLYLIIWLLLDKNVRKLIVYLLKK